MDAEPHPRAGAAAASPIGRLFVWWVRRDGIIPGAVDDDDARQGEFSAPTDGPGAAVGAAAPVPAGGRASTTSPPGTDAPAPGTEGEPGLAEVPVSGAIGDVLDALASKAAAAAAEAGEQA